MPHCLMHKKVLLLALFCVWVSWLTAQNIYLSRVAPGFPGKVDDVVHRIELFNESQAYADISGYYLLTRYYSVRIPPNSFIRPYSPFRMGLVGGSGNELKLILGQLPSYERKNVLRPEEGDFVVLLDDKKTWVDAFYFGPKASVDFLPRSLSLPGNSETFTLKDENAEVWDFLRNPVDPAVAFVRINQEWRANSRTTNLIPATNYRAIRIEDYQDGFVKLTWQTLFERDCFFHYVERSLDGKNFRLLSKKEGSRENESPRSYEFYDTEVDKDRVYFYRITHIDKFGEVIYSPMAKVRTDSNPSGFSFEIIRGEGGSDPSINVRFASRQNQDIRIKLLDEELRELALLYNDGVEAEKQNLISYRKSLPVGKYFIIVVTESRRYYEPFIVE